MTRLNSKWGRIWVFERRSSACLSEVGRKHSGSWVILWRSFRDHRPVCRNGYSWGWHGCPHAACRAPYRDLRWLPGRIRCTLANTRSCSCLNPKRSPLPGKLLPGIFSARSFCFYPNSSSTCMEKTRIIAINSSLWCDFNFQNSRDGYSRTQIQHEFSSVNSDINPDWTFGSTLFAI